MDKWFLNSIIYSLDVETFYDLNDDGIGDFKGLTEKLDYLSGLGVTCLWLLPFFPSPNRDNGYDVIDYYNIDSRLGDLGDFVQFISRCKELGIRVIIDLVINHTSHKHPWFQQARQDKASPFRDFYIWKDKPEPFDKKKLMFHGEEDEIWTYDRKARQYYLHHFYKEQPDLNIGCKALQNEILKIIEFWLFMRVDGFRIDAAEMVIDSYGMNASDKKSLERFLEEIRSFAASKNPDVLLLAEANITPKKMSVYFKEDKRMNMLFNFYANQHLFLSLSKYNATVLGKAYGKLSQSKGTHRYQLLNFLRHHDELSLALLSPADADYVFNEFAPGKHMRIYERGIRRRLAPMINNNIPRLKMLYSLLFSMPGAVLIRYGDEIGMGDDLKLPGRTSVRTPMQWSPAQNAGFSNALGRRLVHPVIKQGEFSFERVNVLEQQREHNSLLNFAERLISTRKQSRQMGAADFRYRPGPSEKVLIHICKNKNESMLFIHNISDEVFTIPVDDLRKEREHLFEVLQDDNSIFAGDLVILAAYGFIWFKIENKK